MRKTLWIGLFLMGLATVLHAQPPSQYEPMGTYQEASDLFEKEKYGAAEKKFEEFIRERRTSSLPVHENDLVAEARFKRGVCAFHLLRNNTQSLLLDFIQDYPSHPDVSKAWYYVGKLHFIKREFDEALPALQEVTASALTGEQRSDLDYMLGYAYYREGDLGKARTYFNRARRGEGPYASSAAYYYAVISYERGDYNEALSAFDQVGKDNPLGKDIPIYKANSLLKLKRYDELEAYREELSSNGQLTGEAQLVFGNAAYEQGDYHQASELISDYAKGRVNLDRIGHYRLGVSHYEQKQYEDAAKHLDRALQPEDEIAQSAYYMLAQSYLRLQDKDKARMAFRQAADLDFDKTIAEDALYQHAKVAFETQDYDPALSTLRELLRTYPDTEYKDEANSLIGEMLLYAHNYREAIEYLEEQSGLRTERAKRAYQRAALFYALELIEKEEYKTANEYFRKAINYPMDAEVTRQSYYWFGESLYRSRQYSQAISTWQSYMAQPTAHKDAIYPTAWYGIAYSYLKQEDWGKAGRAFEKFIALADRARHPDLYIDAHLRAGDMQLMERNYRNAERYYRQVVEFNSRESDYALFQLGIVEFRQDNYQDATKSWERLVQRYRKSEWRDDALIQLSETHLVWLFDWGRAYNYASMLVKDHPSSSHVPTAYLHMGISELKSEQPDKAERLFKKVLFDYCYATREALAALTNLSGFLSSADYDQVEAEYKRKCPEAQNSLDNEAKEDLDYNNALKRYFEDDFARAETKFREFLRDYPYSRHAAEIRYYYGMVLIKQKRENEALQVFQELYQNGPVNRFSLDAMKESAKIYFDRGNYLTSLELFTQLEEKAEDHTDRTYALFGKAESYLGMDDLERARGAYIAIDSDPNTTEYSRTRAQLGLAKVQYELGQKGEALTLYQKLEKANTNVFAAESQYYIGRIYYDQGKYQEAKDAVIYQKKEYPNHNYWKARAYQNLAEVYLALGDTTMAVKGTLKSLAEQDAFPVIAQEAQDRIREINAVWSRGDAMREDGNENGGGE